MFLLYPIWHSLKQANKKGDPLALTANYSLFLYADGDMPKCAVNALENALTVL